MSTEANDLQVGDGCGKQTRHVKMFEGSKVNLSSTKYEINDLKLHFLSTNVT